MSRPDACAAERWLGAISAAVEPVALKIPAYGARMPPNASHGEAVALTAASLSRAAEALSGVKLPPSM